MDDLISRKAILGYPLRRGNAGCDEANANPHFLNGVESVMEYALNLPTVAAEPVRHGRWEQCLGGGKMKKVRKPKPSAPRWFWWDTDNCWWCENRSGCTSCGITKGFPRRREIIANEDYKYQLNHLYEEYVERQQRTILLNNEENF